MATSLAWNDLGNLTLHKVTGANSTYGNSIGASSAYSTVADFGTVTCSGGDIVVEFACRLQRDGNTNANLATFAVFVDGVQVTTAEAGELTYRVDSQNAEGDTFNGFWVITPSAGSHAITVKGKGNHTLGIFYYGYARARAYAMKRT